MVTSRAGVCDCSRRCDTIAEYSKFMSLKTGMVPTALLGMAKGEKLPYYQRYTSGAKNIIGKRVVE